MIIDMLRLCVTAEFHVGGPLYECLLYLTLDRNVARTPKGSDQKRFSKDQATPESSD